MLQAAEWHGEPLDGRSIVVYSEQGLGDTIQFVRFLPELARRGGKLTFLCHPNLMRLFKPLAADFEMVGSIDGGRRFDFQCALMSLPLRLNMPIPRAEPSYLAAEAGSDRAMARPDRHGRLQGRALLAGQSQGQDR